THGPWLGNRPLLRQKIIADLRPSSRGEAASSAAKTCAQHSRHAAGAACRAQAGACALASPRWEGISPGSRAARGQKAWRSNRPAPQTKKQSAKLNTGQLIK